MRSTAILLLFTSLLFLACSEEKDLCPENACEPHGSCVVVNSQAQCNCEPPYEACEELTCCYTGRQMGEPCAEDEDCPLGFCLDYFFDEKYCTSTCESHDECIDHAVADAREMCCVEVETGDRMCLKIAEGHACGDGMGSCGDSCTGSLSSACAPGHPCLRRSDSDPMAICSQPCLIDEDCQSCDAPHLPVLVITCITIAGGDKYCLPTDKPNCRSDAACPPYQVCSYPMLDVLGEGRCGIWGDRQPSEACDNQTFETTCANLLCLEGICRTICQVNSDCPQDMICEEIRLPNWDDGIRICMGDATCIGPDDCIEGESCWPTLNGDSLEGWCRASEGTDPVGTECTDADDRCEVFCMEPFCTEWCTIERDCPKGMTCEIIHFCLAEPCDEPKNTAPGTICMGT